MEASIGDVSPIVKLTQSLPPGEYDRKVKTQKNRREIIKAEDYVA